MSKLVEMYLDKRKMGNSAGRVYSIRERQNRTTKVLYKSDSAVLADVELVVQPAGREATLQRMDSSDRFTKNVHAFLRGTLIYRGRNAKTLSKSLLQQHGELVQAVGYAPQLTDVWRIIPSSSIMAHADIIESCLPITRAEFALLGSHGIWVIPQLPR